MKRAGLPAILAVAARLVLGGAPATPAADASTGRISVVFVAPERFTDVKETAPGGTAAILDELARFVREAGERAVPAGRSLAVSVTDIDLAGELEPWRGPQFERTRLMRDVYAPRIDLEFRLTDAEGRVVREGTRSLTDPNYLTRAVRVPNDRLRYEKDLLREWLRREFGE
jgi:hypothetical protein